MATLYMQFDGEQWRLPPWIEDPTVAGLRRSLESIERMVGAARGMETAFRSLAAAAAGLRLALHAHKEIFLEGLRRIRAAVRRCELHRQPPASQTAGARRPWSLAMRFRQRRRPDVLHCRPRRPTMRKTLALLVFLALATTASADPAPDGGLSGAISFCTGETVFEITNSCDLLFTPTLDAATGDEAALSLNYIVNKATSGAAIGFSLNMIDTLSPSLVDRLFVFQTDGVDQLKLNPTGALIGISFLAMDELKSPVIRASSLEVALIVQDRPFTAASSMVAMATGTSTASSGPTNAVEISPTYNQTGTAAATDLVVNRTETALGSGAQLLMDLQVGGVSKTSVTNTGLVKPGKFTSDPCSAGDEGGLFYNDTSNFLCFCDGTNDVQVSNPAAACF